jgi:O-antigen/teichoic acid export membrane protein
MTTLETILEPPPVTAAPRARSRMFGKNIWAMGDQVLISGANFLTTVLIARSLAPAGFGSYTLVFSAMLLANIFQSTLITQAHNVLAANRSGLGYRLYTANTGLSQLMLAAVEVLIALSVATFGAVRGWPSAPLLFWVAPAVAAWQCQEFTRRVLYTECRFVSAFCNDCVNYGGQSVLFVVLWYTGHLNGISALASLTAAAGSAAVVGFFQIRRGMEFKLDLPVVAENWRFGRWLIGGELLQWLGSLQMYLYLTAYMLGAQATGELRAAQTVFGPTRVFAFYLGSVLPIRFARTLAEKGSAAVNSLLLKTAGEVLPLLGLYCLAIALVPRLVLRLMFGGGYSGHPAVLSAYAVYAFLTYGQTLLVSVLTAKRMTHLVFLGNLWGTLLTLGMSYWIISSFRVTGAPIAVGISALLTTAYFCRACFAGRKFDPDALDTGMESKA